MKKDAVYTVPCMDCDISYISETGRNVHKHIVHHKAAVRRKDKDRNRSPCQWATEYMQLMKVPALYEILCKHLHALLEPFPRVLACKTACN